MRKTVVLLLALFTALSATAQRKELTLESIYDPKTRVYFSGAVQSGFTWLDDNSLLWPKRDERGDTTALQIFDAATGKTRAFFDKAKVQKTLEDAGVPADVAKATANRPFGAWDAKRTAIVIAAADDLFLYNFANNSATRLTSAPGAEEEPTISPDGKRVGFVRGNNLYVVDIASQRERQLTTDGSEKILNGKLDWVYQEEIYGRGRFYAYWWSPDSSRIAFMQLDETNVPSYTIVDHISYHPDLEVYPYPKAGDPNPKAKLFVIPAGGGQRVEVNHEKYSAGDTLIVDVAWSPDNSAVIYQIQNREQTWLDLNSANPASGAITNLFRETTKAWVDVNGSPEWLADGSFLWLSERTGWKHIYHYKPDGTLVRQVTNGEWEVRTLHGAEPKSSTIYFSGTERSHIGSDAYSVQLDGSDLKRLSKEAGTHAVTFSPNFAWYVDNWSDVKTPTQTRLYRRDGSVAHVLEANASPLIAQYNFTAPELMQVKTRDGFVMEAMMIKPANFDPTKKYPVFQHTYAGPHAPQVRNGWRGNGGVFQQLIANQGVIVWICDNRTASGKGAVSAWPMYRNAGESELRDIEDGLTWLKSQPYIDGSRIMISGWSGGGYMTAYALTHSKSFIAGIAGAPVTDWRDYDSIFTERFMGLPQDNPEGYRKSAPRWAAKDLHGKLLLLHGTIDDNVHLQNTLQFAYELQKEGKPFEMMVYPKSRHGISQPQLNLHLQRTMLDFAKRVLLAPQQ
jgi:dipeptidyl-peptidase-4